MASVRAVTFALALAVVVVPQSRAARAAGAARTLRPAASRARDRVAVLVAGHVARYIPRPTIKHLVGSGVRAGLAVDYFVALAGPDSPGLAKKVGAWVDTSGGSLKSFSVAEPSGASQGLVRASWQAAAASRLADLWPEVEAAEAATGRRYRQIVLVREDAYWLDDPLGLWELPVNQGYVRACSNDGTPGVVYFLPRSAAGEIVKDYTQALTGNATHLVQGLMGRKRNATGLVPEAVLLDLTQAQGLDLEGLNGTALPALPAGRAGGFEDACAEPCSTEGCVFPPTLASCVLKPAMAAVPCLDGRDKCYSTRQRLPPADALRFYQMTHIAARLMERHRIWHMASGGTLLGAVRQKGMIPHDDDVDFNIMRSQGQGILVSPAFKQDLSKNGMYLANVHADFWKLKDYSNPNRAVDIFAMVVLGGRVTFDAGKWPGNDLPMSVIGSGGLRKWTFGASQLWAPQYPVVVAHFTAKWGSNWAHEISCKDSYHDCTGVQDVQWDLTGTAMPCTPIYEPQ